MMDIENSKSASSLRRSLLAERIQIRQEWARLKGTDRPTTSADVLKKRTQNKIIFKPSGTKEPPKPQAPSDALRGVVALVEVGSEARALALRAALTAMGASVVPAWTRLVTHLVWANGGCKATRAKARALASILVSPLWVEACAASNRRLPERTFPAAARDSDLPSPATLRRLLPMRLRISSEHGDSSDASRESTGNYQLSTTHNVPTAGKKAEMENIPLVDLLSDSKEGSEQKPMRLRISSEHSDSSDASRESTGSPPPPPPVPTHRTKPTLPPVSLQVSTAMEQVMEVADGQEMRKQITAQYDVEPETRVNTAPRRALPVSTSPGTLKRSRRKLFTQREPDSESEASETEVELKRKRNESTLTQRYKKDLARAERLAKRLAGSTPVKPRRNVTHTTQERPRIVLTGMTRVERHAATNAVRSLNGKIHARVTWKTTHILLGSCRQHTAQDCDITGVRDLLDGTKSVQEIPKCDRNGRTLNALLGAARGCRVLYAQWALDSCKEKRWLHHMGYEVPHLKKISQKARVERKATRLMRAEYAYDVFNGMRVRISSDVSQRDAAIQLLTLCGAVIVNPNGGVTQNGRLCRTQNGRLCQTQNGRAQNGDVTTTYYDVVLGNGENEVISKWVFDSVAAGRMRTTRKYVNTFYDAIRIATH